MTQKIKTNVNNQLLNKKPKSQTERKDKKKEKRRRKKLNNCTAIPVGS